jgi:hypothetical protein
MGETIEDSWFDSRKGKEMLFFKTPDCFWDLSRLLYSVGSPSPRVQRTGRKSGHSYKSSVEIKNAWSYI